MSKHISFREVKRMAEPSLSGLGEAILAAGGQGALARKLGVSQPAVSRWVKCGWVPLLHVVKVEQLFGVPRARLINPKHLALIGGDK
jgi:hypothetical protein